MTAVMRCATAFDFDVDGGERPRRSACSSRSTAASSSAICARRRRRRFCRLAQLYEFEFQVVTPPLLRRQRNAVGVILLLARLQLRFVIITSCCRGRGFAPRDGDGVVQFGKFALAR